MTMQSSNCETNPVFFSGDKCWLEQRADILEKEIKDLQTTIALKEQRGDDIEEDFIQDIANLEVKRCELSEIHETLGKLTDDMLNDSSTRFTDYSVGELKHVIEVKDEKIYFLKRKLNNKEKEIEALRTLVAKQQKEISGLMGRNGESVIMKDCGERDHVKYLTYLLENSAASLPSSDHFSVRPSADPPSSCNTFLPPPAPSEEILRKLFKKSEKLVGLIELQEYMIEGLKTEDKKHSGVVQDNKDELSNIQE